MAEFSDDGKLLATASNDRTARVWEVESGRVLREFRREGAFDAAINLYTSIGYFDDAYDDLRVLRNFHASLRPGGTLLIDIMGREVIARIFREREWRDLPDGSVFLEERRAVRGWTRIANRWLLRASLPTAAQIETWDRLRPLVNAPDDLPNPAKWKRPYFTKAIPLDPWDSEYNYEALSTDSYRIYSSGPDRVRAA